MTKIGVIILVRYNSTRLPGKALKLIGGKPVLTFIIERLLQVFSKDTIVMATSDEKSDDPIVEFAKLQNLKYYRGSLDNVAKRFYNAAKENDFDYAVRINGDNIFIDINLLKKLKNIASNGNYNFISNVKDRTFPKGMSVEIIKLEYYKKLMKIIQKSDRYREHVTLYIYERQPENNHYYEYNTSIPEISGIQLAIDTTEDFTRTEQIITKFTKPHWHYNLEEIYYLLKELNYV